MAAWTALPVGLASPGLSAAQSRSLRQSQPFGRLALVHSVFSTGTTLVTISLAGRCLHHLSGGAKGKVVLYLLLTITPFAVVCASPQPASRQGSYARRASMAVASVGSAVLVLLMAADIRGLLLFPEAFASSCSRSSTWSPRRRWFRP